MIEDFELKNARKLINFFMIVIFSVLCNISRVQCLTTRCPFALDFELLLLL